MEQGGASEWPSSPHHRLPHLQGLPFSRKTECISGMNARGFRAVVVNLLTSGVKDVTIASAAIPFV